MRQASQSTRYASLASAAEYAGLSIKTIRRRIADGSLPAYRVGPKIIRVDLDEVDSLMRRIPAGRATC